MKYLYIINTYFKSIKVLSRQIKKSKWTGTGDTMLAHYRSKIPSL